jgi:DNA-binding Xre family transcriptional regulator
MKIKTQINRIANLRKIDRAYHLTKRLNIHPSKGERLFNDDFKQIALETLGEICEALNCSPNDIFVKADGQQWGRKVFTDSGK